MKKKIKKKILKTLDKIATPIALILFFLFIILLVTGLIRQFQFEKKITHPTKDEVEETCIQLNTLPEGYTIDYDKQEVYINCKIPYEQKQEDD